MEIPRLMKELEDLRSQRRNEREEHDGRMSDLQSQRRKELEEHERWMSEHERWMSQCHADIERTKRETELLRSQNARLTVVACVIGIAGAIAWIMFAYN